MISEHEKEQAGIDLDAYVPETMQDAVIQLGDETVLGLVDAETKRKQNKLRFRNSSKKHSIRVNGKTHHSTKQHAALKRRRKLAQASRRRNRR